MSAGAEARGTQPRPTMALGWLCVAVAVASLGALYLLVREGFEQRDALTMAMLLHGAQLAAAFAHGLSWRTTGSTLHWAAAWSCYAATVAWLYTWLEPLQDVVAWARTFGRLLFDLGAVW